MTKSSQLDNRTLQDLYSAILMDPSIDPMSRQAILQRVYNEVGNLPPSTALSAALPRAFGGGLGVLVGRYFEMGPVGQILLAATGIGLGGLIANKLQSSDRTQAAMGAYRDARYERYR